MFPFPEYYVSHKVINKPTLMSQQLYQQRAIVLGFFMTKHWTAQMRTGMICLAVHWNSNIVVKLSSYGHVVAVK